MRTVMSLGALQSDYNAVVVFALELRYIGQDIDRFRYLYLLWTLALCDHEVFDVPWLNESQNHR